MRTKTTQWFETKVRYDKVNDDGLQKKVTETFTVEALSFSEAERMITENMEAYISGDFDVTAESIAPYKEIMFSDKTEEDVWFKAKVQFITIDEKSNREKKTNCYYLVQASSIESAKKNIDEVFGQTMIDYKIAKLEETCILEVFTHNK